MRYAQLAVKLENLADDTPPQEVIKMILDALNAHGIDGRIVALTAMKAVKEFVAEGTTNDLEFEMSALLSEAL